MGKKKGRSNEKSSWFFQNRKLPLLTILITTFLLYARVVGFEYIGLDDTLLIVENQAFIQDLSNIPQAFQQHVFHIPNQPSTNNYYRPILTLSFMFDAQFGKTDPKVYHFTNITFHILSCLLLLQFFCLLKLRLETAFVLTLVFAVHPILSQAVGWIPGRNDALLTLFTLASLIYFLLAIERSKTLYILLHLFFFMIVLFTKESAIFLPFLCLYYLFFIFKKKLIPKQWLILISGYLTIMLLWFVLRKAAFSEPSNILTLSSLNSNFFENLLLLLQYLTKIIIPYKLSTVSTVKDINYVLGCVAFSLVTLGIVLSKRKRWNRISFGVIWFLLFLLPSFVIPKLTGFEHRVYLPLVGLLILLSELDFIKCIHFNKRTSILVITLISLLIAINVKHTSSFKNRLAFWKTAAEASPHSSLAHFNYGAALVWTERYEKGDNNFGDAYEKKDRWGEAIAEFKKTLAIDPNYAKAHYNLGLAYDEKGRIDEAITEYKRAIAIDPNSAMAYNNLGVDYGYKGMLDEAISEFKKALALNPNHTDAHYNLGFTYNKKGMLDETISEFKKVLAINPADAKVHYKLGLIYGKKGMFKEAVFHFEKAIAIKPDYAEAYNNLAWIYATSPDETLRNGEEAVSLATQACELTKFHNVSLLNTLAAAYAEARNFEKAIEYQTRAIELSQKEAKPAFLKRLERYRSGQSL